MPTTKIAKKRWLYKHSLDVIIFFLIFVKKIVVDNTKILSIEKKEKLKRNEDEYFYGTSGPQARPLPLDE